ncbi:MAG: sigma-70 family RNA polymerase sigma factor [Vicinamibacterales bacterium]
MPDAPCSTWPLGAAPIPMNADAEARDEERRLVAAAAAGDRVAFDALVTRHRRAVYQVCYRFVHDHEDAADLTQETFVRAWRALDRFRGDARVATWLYRIAVNVSLNKKAAPGPTIETRDFECDVDPQAIGPSDAMLQDERRAAVRRAVRSLPPRQRAALVLRTYHDLSHKEVAAIVGTSVGAVKANVFHALANLRKRLEPLG